MAKRSIKFLVNDIKAATVEAARNASVDIMNSLAEKGPAWTGRYLSAWYALPTGDSPSGARSSGKIYKYDLRNVPKSRFKEGFTYTIVNGMSYADQAQDLVPFIGPGEPLKPPPSGTVKEIKRGNRPEGGLRGEFGYGKPARRTAPLNWYLDYINNGSLQKDLGKGAKRGFGTFKPTGFGR